MMTEKYDHKWEPDFSDGEPPLDTKICGICGEEHNEEEQE